MQHAGPFQADKLPSHGVGLGLTGAMLGDGSGVGEKSGKREC